MNIPENERAMFENFTEYRTMKYLWCGISPILLFFGTFGNIMVFVVLRRQSRTASTYIYLMTLAGADEVVILFTLSKRWVEHFFGINAICYHSITCKLYVFITSSFSHISVWVIVLVTMERLFVVMVPFKATGSATMRTAWTTLVVLLVVSCLINFHFFFTVDVQTLGEVVHGNNWTLNVTMHYCDFRPDLPVQFYSAWPWLDGIVYNLAPLGLILVSNILIVYKLREAQIVRNQLTADQPDSVSCLISTTCCLGKQYRRSSHEIHKTAMLLIVSLVFLICATPIAILKITISVLSKYTDYLQKANFNVIFILLNTISELLMLTNHSANFFLYCMAGQKFRRDFQRAMRCRLFRIVFDMDQDPLERLSFGNKQEATLTRSLIMVNQSIRARQDHRDIELQLRCASQCLFDSSNKFAKRVNDYCNLDRDQTDNDDDDCGQAS